MVELGDRVSAMEDQETSQLEDLKQLQQEVICLKKQQIDLQALAEAVENRSRQNNIRIRGAPPENEVRCGSLCIGPPGQITGLARWLENTAGPCT
ncbi:hypothetical protein NDU88_000934 [Pleurodeles waltl]|uniref:Uncharacterized protein n=1 Tax=Pleurodeles waltl TaxID=8319 RepID=A0AAV7WKQ0_PLEWA|nr:hypothetical protein NDU88_000934 [Pleurodeles waltl]